MNGSVRFEMSSQRAARRRPPDAAKVPGLVLALPAGLLLALGAAWTLTTRTGFETAADVLYQIGADPGEEGSGPEGAGAVPPSPEAGPGGDGGHER